MIRTEQEYQRALIDLKRDAEVFAAQRQKLIELGLSDEQLTKALQPMQSFRAQLREEIETYEKMRRGDLGVLHDLTSIGRWLIGIRIARGMTQRELAEKLGVSESQVSRDERNDYHGVSVDRAQRILEAMDVRFRMEVQEPVVDPEQELALTP